MSPEKSSLTASDRPYRAPIDRAGERRGLAIGLVIGALTWIVLGVAVWRVLL